MTILELTPFLALFIALGIQRLKKDTFFVSYFSGAILTLILLRHREPRFILDFSPVLALSAGAYASSLQKKKLLIVLSLLFLQSVGEAIYTSQSELHIKEAGLFIASSPEKGAVISNEEAQMYYYTQRKVYFYPPSKEEYSKLLTEDVTFIMVNQCLPPPYIDSVLQNSQWNLAFVSQKGCGASVYSVKKLIFNVL